MERTVSLTLLERASIASPCEAKWEDMRGDDRKRRCDLCALDVYNVSAMSRDDAEALFARHFNADGSARADGAGRLCARLWRRTDGTLITADCPRGLAAVRAKAWAAWRRVGAAAVVVIGAILGERAAGEAVRIGEREPFAWIARVLRPSSAPVPPMMPMGAMVAGDIAMPLAPVPPPPAQMGGRVKIGEAAASE